MRTNWPYSSGTDEEGYVFIDRNGEAFGDILEWLRCQALPSDSPPGRFVALQREAHYYGIQSLVKRLAEGMVQLSNEHQSSDFKVIVEKTGRRFDDPQYLTFCCTVGGRNFRSKPISRIGDDQYFYHRVPALVNNFNSGLFTIQEPVHDILLASIPLEHELVPVVLLEAKIARKSCKRNVCLGIVMFVRLCI